MKKVILIGFPVLVGLGVIFPVNPVPKVPGTRKGMCLEGTLKKKITNYKLQNTNKFQITISKGTNSRVEYKDAFLSSCRRRENFIGDAPRPQRGQLFLEFVILGLWFVCNLYFVFCNFRSSQALFGSGLSGLGVWFSVSDGF